MNLCMGCIVQVGMDEMTEPGTYIISFWNDTNIFGGIHTIAVSYDGDLYTAYNLDGDGRQKPLRLYKYTDRYICGYYLR